MARQTKPFISSVTQNINDLREAKRMCSQRYLKTHLPPKGKIRAPLVSPAPEQNVVGVGISEKIVDGLHTGVLCVKIYVRVKYPLRKLLRRERLPKSTYGLPVDVVEVGELRSLSASVAPAKKAPGTVISAPLNLTMPNPKVRMRPARPGCSIGFEDPAMTRSSVGTFGALVRDSNSFYILSNNHVLADANGLPLNSTNILQPALFDDPNITGNRLGTLANFKPLVPGVSNKVDCAIAKVAAGQVSNDILHIGPPQSKGNATRDMTVHKFGRSTDYRVGSVKDVDADVTIGFPRGTFKFENQIMILGVDKVFAQEGDSGALVLERGTQKAVGLLFAVSVSPTTGQLFAVANHINDVLDALGVTLVF